MSRSWGVARDLPDLLAEGAAAAEALESIGQHIRHEFPYSGKSRLPTIANVVRDLVAALTEAAGMKTTLRVPQQNAWVTFFPYGDHKPSGGFIVYGPFESEEAAKEHARTLSLDPDEGEIARLVQPDVTPD